MSKNMSDESLQDAIAADIPSLNADGVTSAVMRTIRTSETKPRKSFSAPWQIGVGSLAMAALVFLVVAKLDSPDLDDGFQSRGGDLMSNELARNVGAHFLVLDDTAGTLSPVQQGAFLPATAKLTLSYVNAISNKSVYMLAFVLDSAGEIYWLYPAYTDEATNPLAIKLETQTNDVVLPETIALEHPAKGMAHLVWLTSLEQLSVSSIETLPQNERTPKSLKRLWPNAEIGHLRARLVQ